MTDTDRAREWLDKMSGADFPRFRVWPKVVATLLACTLWATLLYFLVR